MAITLLLRLLRHYAMLPWLAAAMLFLHIIHAYAIAAAHYHAITPLRYYGHKEPSLPRSLNKLS